MKALTILCLVTLLSVNCFAQIADPVKKSAKESRIAKIVNYVGLECAVDDSLYGYKVMNPDQTVLYLGGNNPNNVMNVILKGNVFKYKQADFVGKWVYVTGKVEMEIGKPTIVVTDPTNIRIFKRAVY